MLWKDAVFVKKIRQSCGLGDDGTEEPF